MMGVRLVWMATLVAVGLLMVPATASAQHGDITDDVRFEDELNPNEFMVTGRFRAIRVPNFVLGIFFDHHASHWSDGQRNFSYGGEFVWRRGNDFELGVAFDYADLAMPDEYWQEAGDPARSAELTEVDLQIYSVVFTAYWFWNVTDWFAPYLGGGVGLGFTGGDIVRYELDSNNRDCYDNLGSAGETVFPSQCYEDDAVEDDANPEENVWPVYPMVNLTTGMRFNIMEHGVVKLEAGIHPYLFAGTAVGVQF